MLERSVALDSGYAPAWDALGVRYDYEAVYSEGGAGMLDRAGTAYERAVALDPNFLPSPARLARLRVERGDLAHGYQQAKDMVGCHPDSAQAHFVFLCAALRGVAGTVRE